MKKQLKILLTGFCVVLSLASTAQQANNEFKIVDDYVKSLGSLDTLNMGTISYVVTKKFSESRDKVRAIFDWIAYNISFDCKAARNNGNEKTNSDDVLKFRRTTSTGYATLFQDMCSVVKIRCLTVNGYAKYSVEDINEIPDQFNHAWVVVQLGQSPESWYYVDPTWGSGFTDAKMTTYTKQFNDDYFFANKSLFNFQHFPDNKAWQIGAGPKSVKDFFELPLVKHKAYEFGLAGFVPQNGFIKSTVSKPVLFNIRINAFAKVDIVALEIGTEKRKSIKTVDYTYNNGLISFSYKFDEDDAYPVTILINNKPVLGYFAEVVE
jgi:hypothetical protein